ncbi:DUF475 domain-containing protein [Candidatus Roizmanbacteria bacterium]|nr:DUF475 domain-containing protein [Candidatus Roizmanbacteria bacterium]
MSLLSIILTILGLSLFEIVSSVDNAIINAEVLSTMQKWARGWFLFWGLTFAVFIVIQKSLPRLNHPRHMAFDSVLGSTAFFIVHGFRQNAELEEQKLLDRSSKIKCLH